MMTKIISLCKYVSSPGTCKRRRDHKLSKVLLSTQRHIRTSHSLRSCAILQKHCYSEKNLSVLSNPILHTSQFWSTTGNDIDKKTDENLFAKRDDRSRTDTMNIHTVGLMACNFVTFALVFFTTLTFYKTFNCVIPWAYRACDFP